jgi:virulence factor
VSQIRFALIGAGSMATTFHYPSLVEFPEVELAGICDIDAAKRQAAVDRFKIPRQFSDYREMLDATQPAAVCCFMPPHHLFDIAIECLQRGLHLFIEKPPGVNTFQTKAMAREAAQHGSLTMVGFNRRHDPLLNRALDTARGIGEITQVYSSFFKGESAVYYGGAMDVIGCDAVHAVDAIRYMAGGEVIHTASTVGQYASPVSNSWNALIVFSNRVVGVLESNWSTGGRIHRFKIHSDGYSAYLEQLTSMEELVRAGRGRRTRTAEELIGRDASDPRKLNGFYQQARHFVDCILEGRQPSSHFADAVRTMQLVDAIRSGYTVPAA